MILAQIHNAFETLTQTEQRIASFILKYPEKSMHMTAKELAAACDTVPSAVNRMCKSIGLEGFARLKIALASAIARGDDEKGDLPFNKEDNEKTIFGKVFHSGITTIKNTYQMLDFSDIKVMAQKLLSANRIFVFGVGTSSVIAMDAAYRLSQLDIQAYAYTDILQMGVMAKNMKAGDIAFGISHSGMTKAVVDTMRAAKKAGATTMGLTSFAKSYLYEESDHSVCVYADEKNYPVEAVSARVAHICIIDALMLTVASYNYDDYAKHISLRNEALDNIRY